MDLSLTTERKGGERMSDETHAAELAAYEATVGQGFEEYAEVTVAESGCVVRYVKRDDGVVVWLDRDCRRATPPGFAMGSHPFTEGAVAAWHAGQAVPVVFGYRAELAAAAAELDEARRAMQRLRHQVPRWERAKHAGYQAAVVAEGAAVVRRSRAVRAAMRGGRVPVEEVMSIGGVSRSVAYQLAAEWWHDPGEVGKENR
jgi:hypothetical protein